VCVNLIYVRDMKTGKREWERVRNRFKCVCVDAVMFVFLSRDPSETAIPDITYYYNIRYLHVVVCCGCVYYNILYGSDDRQRVDRVWGTSLFGGDGPRPGIHYYYTYFLGIYFFIYSNIAPYVFCMAMGWSNDRRRYTPPPLSCIG